MKNETKITAEEGKQELFIIREFDAPRELLFRAHTDPTLYTRWLGPKGYTMKLDQFEPRSGGSYKFTHTTPEGLSFSFHGIYHEVLPPERMIGTFEFDGLPEKGHVEMDTSKFESLPGGRSRLTIHAIYQSVEDRDAMIKSGMERGITEGFSQLDDVLDSIKSSLAINS
jgi:uncharacterized protein YndB with AHSA1/START domain